MDRRYTNQDVLDDLRLTHLAYRYLDEYAGTFGVVLDFQTLYRSGYTLNATQIRTVLNCMLADSRVQNMPNPLLRVFDGSREFAQAFLGFRAPRPRPASIEVKADWKKPFVVSKSSRACRIHRLDRHRSTITYYPQAPKIKQWAVKIRPLCSSDLSMVNMRLLTLAEARELVGTTNAYLAYFTFCGTCDAVDEERGEQSHG